MHLLEPVLDVKEHYLSPQGHGRAHRGVSNLQVESSTAGVWHCPHRKVCNRSTYASTPVVVRAMYTSCKCFEHIKSVILLSVFPSSASLDSILRTLIDTPRISPIEGYAIARTGVFVALVCLQVAVTFQNILQRAKLRSMTTTLSCTVYRTRWLAVCTAAVMWRLRLIGSNLVVDFLRCNRHRICRSQWRQLCHHQHDIVLPWTSSLVSGRLTGTISLDDESSPLWRDSTVRSGYRFSLGCSSTVAAGVQDTDFPNSCMA